jgi:hypothetical protein
MPGPNYVEYHKTVTAELRAIKDRLNHLTHHRLSRGEFKEAALRAVLRRHLPASLRIGRGFIVTEDACSTQIDLLIVDDSTPVLFQDGDLLVVTPDAVRAAVEVKTQLSSRAKLRSSLDALGKASRQCAYAAVYQPWLGLFVYESALDDGTVLEVLVEAASETDRPVHCVTYGEDRFFRYWPLGEHDRGAPNDDANLRRFRGYNLDGLAPSYFMGNLTNSVMQPDHAANAYAWFPLWDGKGPHRTEERVWQEANLPPETAS